MAPPKKPIGAGERFGSLVVTGFSHRTEKSDAYYEARCDCGRKVVVAQKHLRGRVRSCKPCSRTRHGMSQTAEHLAWSNMRRRCEDPSNVAFANYGGRGIRVCDSWRESFDAFFENVGPRPSSRHSLDRIDNERGYEPGNVRWATRAEQSRNRRDNRRLAARGETLCLSDWATRLGTVPDTIDGRLKRGWSVERAVTEPIHAEKRNHR